MPSSHPIKWCDATINPIVGCAPDRISPGCANCYAAKMAYRLGHGGLAQDPDVFSAYQSVIDPKTKFWNGRLDLVGGSMIRPDQRIKPTTYFLGSMTDIGALASCAGQSTDARQYLAILPKILGRVLARHTFLILTKRPGPWLQPFAALENVWLGASASNQADLDRVAPLLCQYGGSRTFLSLEPLLGLISLGHTCPDCDGSGTLGDQRHVRTNDGCVTYKEISCETCGGDEDQRGDGFIDRYDTRFSAVIVGGESGAKARPMHPDWVRSLRDECAAANVPFFFKQWGEWSHTLYGDNVESRNVPQGDGTHHRMYRVGKKLAGRLLDGREHNALPWPVGPRKE